MSFPGDSALVHEVVPSPNHGERKGGPVDMLILHYTGMANAQVALDRLCEAAAQVSAHYLVFEDGRIAQLVPESQRAWHAGLGCWQGERDINSRSLGIEIVHPGHIGGLPPYPAEQIDAVIALSKDIVARNAIPAERVLAHSDVAPERKEDPGENFPWERLARAGVGHLVKPAPIRDGRFFSRGDSGEPIRALQEMFALYGYDQPVSGIFDLHTQAVVTAFQRHFRQARVDGVADASTITTLRDLIAMQPAG
ncbi:N-acetylmuramoyl-L-alanine amidase [Methylobacterium gnaphalii]|uniref:N-acetylmuramoyl-L-alanine amidase n=1 Tax=Methylobacterium gnaphalii TaxID=1010610 RepID=A0A512JH28_9HYPH|nr:N-acetylmuramoyl-L-alanine amidase [Methylobacterium gnaphalii]GEP09261.1 N-acetylmuramoyl-L-alanine amidase [Methylobacterium gnaphalii]GJD69041.1 N-acetylmuramoyl-L-alanine amidase AmiD [Methylobacterium gnaphalii]GLS49253.1 N-acetylmuramoyl-L-alanine amidase [Methylobacterium gnaphalii]